MNPNMFQQLENIRRILLHRYGFEIPLIYIGNFVSSVSESQEVITS